MKIPARPPAFTISPELVNRFDAVDLATDPYYPWERMQWRAAPAGLTRQEWWSLTTLARRGSARHVPLRQINGDRFWYSTPDEVLSALDGLAPRAGGNVGVAEPITNSATRDRYLVRNLMEEAITSSQLEGAATTRRVAQQMLRSGRSPRTVGERMIWNNYQGMEFVRSHQHDPITPDLVRELHAVLTDGTLDDAADRGRLQTPDEQRVRITTNDDDTTLHEPPSADELPRRLDELCEFANSDDGPWTNPILRAVLVHFMVGHDHYFVDGNGRLARTLFYWVMLQRGFWLTEFVTISTILRKAPVQYAHAYLNTEYEGDATFFLIHQLDVLTKAFDDLDGYVDRTVRATRDLRRHLRSPDLALNHRQLAIMERALTDSSLDITMQSHATSHRVSLMTARSDLMKLEELGLLERHKEIRTNHWWPAPDIERRMNELRESPDRI